MRILLFHADMLEYETTRKALRNPPDPPGKYTGGPLVAVFVSVEEDDSRLTVEAAAGEILKYSLDTVKEDNIVIYPYAHLSSRLARPEKAHRLLVLLEEELNKTGSLKVHRAPFGWYKKFTIKVKGHPLSELSRTIKPEPTIEYEGSKYPLSEALKTGAIPSLPGRIAASGLLLEKLELFNVLNCSSWWLDQFSSRLESRIIAVTGRDRVKHELLRSDHRPGSPLDALRAIIELLQAGPGRSGQVTVYRLAGCPSQTMYLLPIEGSGEARSVLDAILHRAGSDSLRTYPEGELRVSGQSFKILYYENSSGPQTPIGAVSGETVILGPLWAILYAVLDSEVSLASRGVTPYLPIWLHPVSVALIPAKAEQAEYAGIIAYELARHGVTTVVLEPPGSIGQRIRQAAKYWIPMTGVVGPREVSTGTVTVRKRWKEGEQEVLAVSELVEQVSSQLASTGGVGLRLRSLP